MIRVLRGLLRHLIYLYRMEVFRKYAGGGSYDGPLYRLLILCQSMPVEKECLLFI